MQKVAFIFSQFPAYDETFILREMNELDKTGLVFDIYSLKTPKDKIVHDEAKVLASRTSYLPFFSWRLLRDDLYYLFRYPRRYLRTFFGVLLMNLPSPNFFLKTCALWYKSVGFARLAHKTGVTHVHGQWATFPATVALIISRLNNIPFSFTGHAHDIHLDTTALGHKIKEARFVTSCTGDNKSHLMRLLKGEGRREKGEKIFINYHGVDLRRFASSQVTSHKSQVIKILSVGSLLECKGFNYLIEACKILKDEGVDFECTIAGGGKLEESLKSQVTGHRLEEKVKFTGYITQDKLIPLYKEADVFVLAMVPEIHWGIPNVLLEALACGVPVVCTMLPSIPELVRDGETGFVIPAKDPTAIAVAVKKLSQDDALRNRIGEAGRKVVEEKFDVAKNAKALKELFES
jgi:colanic acid/amylovoran biosynthesis glycosyltransferase